MSDTLLIEREGFDTAQLPTVQDIVPTDRRLLPAPLEALQEVAAMMASAGALVPAPLRGKPDVCLAVAYMAALHGTDPIATASQTYLVSDKIAFMAQYINAIVRPHLEANPTYTFQGSGASRAVMVTATPKGGQPLTYQSPIMGQIKPRNSPLWQTDPDQQLCYYGVRAWARRHMPGVLLGIYAVEELQAITVRDVSPTVNRFDDADIDDLPEAEVTTDEPEAFEPSGGFSTDKTEPQEHATPPETYDDPMVFFSECKSWVADAPDRQALRRIWETTEADRRALFDADPASSLTLDEAFQDRGKTLPR